MRVGANHQIARHHHTLLGQQRMLNTCAALFPVVGHMLLVRKVAHLLGLLSALDILVGRVMVGHQAHAVAVKDLGGTQLAKNVDGDGRRDVVCQHQVKITLNKLAGTHLIKPSMGRQDLLSYGHRTSHGYSFIFLRGFGHILRAQTVLGCASLACGTAPEDMPEPL